MPATGLWFRAFRLVASSTHPCHRCIGTDGDHVRRISILLSGTLAVANAISCPNFHSLYHYFPCQLGAFKAPPTFILARSNAIVEQDAIGVSIVDTPSGFGFGFGFVHLSHVNFMARKTSCPLFFIE